MDDLIRDFVAETREGIEALDSELVRFEQHPDNPELLGGVFRLIHTIKGTSGFIGLTRLQAVAHAAETVLGGFRDGSVVVTSEAVSAVLQAVDLIRGIVEDLAAAGIETQGDDSALILRLETAARAGGGSGSAPEPQSAPQSEPEPFIAAPTDSRTLFERLGGEATIDAACEMGVARIGATPGLESLAGADLDRLQGALRDSLCSAARGFGDGAAFVALLQAAASGMVPTAPVITALMDAVAQAFAALDIAAADVDQLKALTAPAPDTLAVDLEAFTPPADDLMVSGDPVAETFVAQEPAASRADTPPSASGPADPATGQTIRVGVDALEHLMTVASELVLIRNQLLQLLRLDPESPFAAPLHRLNQVTSELQEGVMTTRMQPISGAWAKLPRLVRDLARDLGKKIDLSLHGQDTELDRQVLELIKDPLTHMIRNAADHGLETPAERAAAGKPEAGRITLASRHEGGAIVIEMIDDGRGLSAARIRAKAVASGAVTASQAEAMSDAEARRLIFLPGFSTAAEVTAVSGRGVGMDVVRTNIEKIGGVIEVESVEGAGARFTIRIPLTLTIVSALIVECCGERFAMPQSSVVELVSASDASAHNIEYIDGSAVLRLRDRLLPLVPLQTLLGLPLEDVRRDETCIVVARVGQAAYGVIVDRVFDTEEIVVKPVSSVLRHLKVYSGATILGDGSVVMILDFKGMSPALDADSSATVNDTAQAGEGLEQNAILVFRVAEDVLKATPLAEVARIEEISEREIERVDGRSVIQYRGRLMPVVGADGAPVTLSSENRTLPLLVFTRDEQSVGVLVEEIVDIVESALAYELDASGEEAAGSLIIAGRSTEVIDVDYFWRRAMGVPAKAAQPKSAAGPVPETAHAHPNPKRLLVVDQSPFSQLLLRPLLAQAGYDVSVAGDPDAAMVMHDAGERFDLIMADTSEAGGQAQQLAHVFGRANSWRGTPLVGVGLQNAAALEHAFRPLTVENDPEHMRGAA